MNSPAYAEASLARLEPAARDARAAEVTRPDALFVLNNLGYGGSERKIARLANRLTEEGQRVSMVCLNGPYDIEQGLRRDVACTRLERRGKLSLAALWRLRRVLAQSSSSSPAWAASRSSSASQALFSCSGSWSPPRRPLARLPPCPRQAMATPPPCRRWSR